MTRDRNLAEEVRQEVFVDACRDLGHVAVPSALPTWIFGIARHRCLDAVEAQLRWNRRYKNDPPGDREQDDCEPDRDLDRRRLAQLLATCLTALTPAARDAVVLRYQQELSYDEAAAIAGDLPGSRSRAALLGQLDRGWLRLGCARHGRRGADCRSRGVPVGGHHLGNR